MLLKSQEGVDRQHWQGYRKQSQLEGDQPNESRAFQHEAQSRPCLEASRKEEKFRDYPARRHHQWIHRRRVVVLSVRQHKKPYGNHERPPERSVSLGLGREKIKEQPGKPEREGLRAHHQNLLLDKRERRKRDVSPGGSNIVHELEKWPVMMNIP